jgi:type I restriction enzyme, S subunit
MSEWVGSTYGAVAPSRRERSLDHPEVNTLLSVTAVGGVIDQSKSGRRDISAPDKSKYLIVRPGDVVYNTMRMWQGVSGYSQLEGIASPAYTVVSPDPSVMDGRFLAYLMKRPENIALYRSFSQGLVSDTWNLKYRALAQLPLEVPPLEEQRRIAEILDTIDETIQATERVISKARVLFEGYVACVFGESSTWEQIQVGDVLDRIESGKSPEVVGRSPGDNEWGVLKVSAVQPSGFRAHESKVLSNDQIRPQDEVRTGDVLVTRANTPELVGLCCLVGETRRQLQLSDKTLRLVPTPRVTNAFLAMSLQSRSARRQIEISGTGSSGTMKNISQGEIRSISIGLPELSEQRAFTFKSNGFEGQIHTERQKLDKLQRTRSGLAADLLSGRVRTVAS